MRIAISTGIVAALMFAGLLAAGSAASADAPSAKEDGFIRCQQAVPIADQYGPVTAVVGGERTTIGNIVTWQENRIPGIGVVSRYRGLPAEMPATVCLFQGQFPIPIAPPLPGTTPLPQPNVLRLIIFDNGTVDFDSAGPLGRMQPDTPSDLPQTN